MKTPFLVGEKIYLRMLYQDDAYGNYINWLNDPEVCVYNSHHYFPYVYSSAQEYIQASWKNVNAIILAIILKENDEHIGNIALQKIDFISRNAEFAVLIGEKKYCGIGLAKEASVLIIRHGFFELNLHRIHCGTSVNNIAMQKLAAFLGMNKEGLRRDALFKHGKYCDIIEYGLLKKDFNLRVIDDE